MIKAKMIKRQYRSLSVDIGVPVFSILLAFVVSGAFLYFSGFDPGETFLRMFKGAFGSSYAIAETIVKAILLMLAGLAVSLAFRMKLWNIGAEGQLYMGAFCCLLGSPHLWAFKFRAALAPDVFGRFPRRSSVGIYTGFFTGILAGQ